jgi:hypothetical protein
MGRFLLHIMLRVEYDEKRQTPISNLSIADANMRLKEQIRKFLKAVYPFDRDLRPRESAYQWWVNLDQDRSNDTQPLAVSTKYSTCPGLTNLVHAKRLGVAIFAIVPNSMVDEQTGSTFTWLNSHLRNRQQVKTLIRTVQIQKWYKYNPL